MSDRGQQRADRQVQMIADTLREIAEDILRGNGHTPGEWGRLEELDKVDFCECRTCGKPIVLQFLVDFAPVQVGFTLNYLEEPCGSRRDFPLPVLGPHLPRMTGLAWASRRDERADASGLN